MKRLLSQPLCILVSLLVAAPAFAVMWHRGAGGEILFVLYRQPKLAAVAMLGWLFVATFVWHFVWLRRPLTASGRSLERSDLAAAMTQPGARWLVAFVVYMALTGLWVRVGSNYRYELRQWILLLLLLACWIPWFQADRTARRVVRTSLLLSLALVSVVGLVQAVVPLPWLSPINPQIGAVNPSFMGYKNPMALALLGQLFLVARQAWLGPQVHFWRGVLVLELVYLATLGSRTSYFALGLGGVYWVVLRWLQKRRDGRRPSSPTADRPMGWSLAGPLALVCVFGVALVIHPVARQKALSVASYVASPGRYLESDRGIYLRNTLNMAAHRPWGVGLGDWQTHYPIYRLHGRDVAFDDRFQVRRAHSDPVQFLGEGGWPGALLWAGFAVALLLAAHRGARRGSVGEACFAAQWLVLFVAMGTDYLLELPYNKFQFCILLALFWGRGISPPSTAPTEISTVKTASDRDRWLRGGLVAVAMVAMMASLHHYTQVLKRTVAAASVGQAYARWSAGDATAWPVVLGELARYERTLAGGGGETKTLHKDYLQLAHLAQRTGRSSQALIYAQRSLRHHPYYAPAFRFLGDLVADPNTAEDWRRGYDFLMQRATVGWSGSYPSASP